MEKKQRQLMDSLVRVRSFLEAHPAIGALSYADARETLDDVIGRVDGHAGHQILGRELSRAESRRQQEQVSVIYDRHIRPIVMIARAQIQPDADVGLPAGLRMPKADLPPTRLLAACSAMIEAARPYEAMFVAKGLPADFLAQFEAAREKLTTMRGNRAVQVRRHVTARAGLFVELRRGRLAVAQLDGIVRASYRGDFMTLSAWRHTKRVHHVPGGAGSLRSGEATKAAA